MALDGLEGDMTEQVNKINTDIEEIDSAFAKWAESVDETINDMRLKKENCYSVFEDWATLWPGIHNWLDSETTSIVSGKTVSTIQGVIGEWRALRAIALAIKVRVYTVQYCSYY